MYKAKYFDSLENGDVRCILCPNNCTVKLGNVGVCGARKNSEGILYSVVYGKVSGYRIDPIEKKPLYHFYPGSSVLSVGSYGCNLKCQFCQNCEISQPDIHGFSVYNVILNDKILHDSKNSNYNIGLAFTYNEPTVWFEFMQDLAIENKKNGLMNVMVSNGYINAGPLNELLETIDAFNIDLKGFSETFYKKNTKSTLKPVLSTLKKIRESGKHLEITNLVIPGENDDFSTFKEMIYWINDNLGENTVLHLSRYFPNYNFNLPPTDTNKLLEFYDFSSEILNYVYLGNVNLEKGSDTICPSCKSIIIRRRGYSTQITGLSNDRKCKGCNFPIEIEC